MRNDAWTSVAAELAKRYQPPKPGQWKTPGALAQAWEPTTRQTTALQRLDERLVDVQRGDTTKLMWFMPPQEGKSQRVSRWFPSWLLTQDPTLRIAIVSFEQERAVRWGRQIRRDVEAHPSANIRLAPDAKAAGRWHTNRGGGVYCVGIGGALTGEPVDVLIIDDPVKGRAEAESKTYRDAAWDWWESVAETRLSTRGRVVLIMTRWHEDDLAGRLLRHEPGEWDVVRIRAIAEDDDPLMREPGEELESAQNRKPGHFRRLEQVRSDYVWRSVYQQSPTAAKGNLFLRDRWRFHSPTHMPAAGRGVDLDGRMVLLSDCFRFATVDLAASERTSADFTVACAWAITPSSDLVLLDRAKDRVAEGDHWGLVRPLLERWQLSLLYVESRMFGTTLVYEAGQNGIPVQELVADADKLTRALPAVARVKARKVWLPRSAHWLDDWIDEHAEFPSSEHDDQVDNTAYAARVAAAHWMPQESGEVVDMRRAIRQARQSDEVDLMTAQW